jgi:hypothetical protein
MKLRAALVLTLATVLGSCGVQSNATPPATTSAHPGTPYRLYTHCGIQWARIDGTFWQATKPLSDGNGNPPPGWGNPYQQGTLTLTSHTTAEFTSPVGNATFKRTERTQPPDICS